MWDKLDKQCKNACEILHVSQQKKKKQNNEFPAQVRTLRQHSSATKKKNKNIYLPTFTCMYSTGDRGGIF